MPTKETTAWVQGDNRLYQPTRYQMMLYRILPEYAVIFNESNGNSLNLTNPPHNIINGYGIFTGMSISDTLILNVIEK
jgi:hypothetical protein